MPEHPATGARGFLSVEAAADILQRGGIVGIPTETVYGLAANAFNTDAVISVFEAKQRPSFDPLIVHIAEIAMLDALAAEVPDAARKLADHFWPGPLTLVLPKRAEVPDVVTAGLETVGIRFPSHAVAQELIRAAGCPLAAPSANLFSRVSPTCAAHVMDQLADRIDGVVDGGPCKIGVESTIVGFWEGHQLLLRPGAITRDALEAVIGPVEQFEQKHAADIPAPGTMPRHYAPHTHLTWRDEGPTTLPHRVGHLCFANPTVAALPHAIDLSPSANLHEAAANLYHAMRELDAMELDLILVDRVPNHDIGLAINDRLTRAM
jgi:L-threonylcarbamoyladenylate synthase